MAERRRRIRTPRRIVAVAVVLMLLPLIHIAATAWAEEIPLAQPGRVLSRYSALGLLFLYLSPMVGALLLRPRPWSWYLFLGYAFSVGLYNFVELVRTPSLYMQGSLLRAVLGFGFAALAIKRDIYSPYLAIFPRGFRRKRRVHKRLKINVDGHDREALDISDSGCFVRWKGCEKPAGTELKLQWAFTGAEFDAIGGIVRITDAGVGIAFRGTDSAWRNRLRTAFGNASAEKGSDRN